MKEITNSCPQKFMRTTAQMLHPIYVSAVLIESHRFLLCAVLTCCYRSIIGSSSQIYSTATTLKVIVKHCFFFQSVCRINAPFQTERAAAWEISKHQLSVAGRQAEKRKVLSFSQVFHCIPGERRTKPRTDQ